MSRTVRLLVGLALLGGLAAAVAPAVHSMAAESRDGGKGGGAEPDIAFLEPGTQNPSSGPGSNFSRGADGNGLNAESAAQLSIRRWIESMGRRVREALLQVRRGEAARTNRASR